MAILTLQESPKQDDQQWRFFVDPDSLRLPATTRARVRGKLIKFTHEKITLDPQTNLPSNRILHNDDPSRFILLSFKELRFPESTLSQNAEYIERLVQLRPSVRNFGREIQYDVSMLERLYAGEDRQGMRRSMLEVQYRFSKELASFPSRQFYEGKLQTGSQNSDFRVLAQSQFPWAITERDIYPVVFVPNLAEETGGMSKSNLGQVTIISHIVKLLQQRRDPSSPTTETQASQPPLPQVTVLSPYTKQNQELRRRLPNTVPVHTIDSFQGRECDVIILSSVRSNAENDLGFLEDERRLNVMWTRARLGLIIVGNDRTLKTNDVWREAIEACRRVEIALPDDSEGQ